jgi:hypothetical protein
MPDNASAGATPVVAGATPAQTAPQGDTGAAAPVETDELDGDAANLGEPGKRALARMKAELAAEARARKVAEKELEGLRTASQSEQEKAIAQARQEGAAEALSKANTRVRRSEVRRVLAGQGCLDVDLAATAIEFAELEVDDNGEVLGLDKAVTAFRSAHTTLFAPKRPTGSADAGGNGRPAPQSEFTREQLRDPKFYAEHREDILKARATGNITD